VTAPAIHWLNIHWLNIQWQRIGRTPIYTFDDEAHIGDWAVSRMACQVCRDEFLTILPCHFLDQPYNCPVCGNVTRFNKRRLNR